MTRHDARQLLLADIKNIIETASASGGMLLRTRCYAQTLARKHTEFSLGRVIDELTIAAASAGLPVEISRPRKIAHTAAQSEAPRHALQLLPSLLPGIRSTRAFFESGSVAFSRKLLFRTRRAATPAGHGQHRPNQ